MTTAQPKIAICFFGITRALKLTLPSIEDFILAPARARGDVRIFGHLYDLPRIENPRSGESVDMDPDEHKLITWDHLEREKPGACLDQWNFEGLKRHGDKWRDDFVSMRNLVHQLHSLQRVHDMAGEFAPDIIIFVRPDMRYGDSLGPVIDRALAAEKPTVYLPFWQAWFGYNDRFAVINNADLARRYARRIEQADAFCVDQNYMLHAERLVRFVLRDAQVETIDVRAWRVRATGEEHNENFDYPLVARAHLLLTKTGLPMALRKPFHKGLGGLQRAVRTLARRRRAA